LKLPYLALRNVMILWQSNAVNDWIDAWKQLSILGRTGLSNIATLIQSPATGLMEAAAACLGVA